MTNVLLYRKLATTIRNSGEHEQTVRLYQTDILRFDDLTITIDTGGWNTQLTRNRINQAAREFSLAFHVRQEKGQLYAIVSRGNGYEKYPIDETLTFARGK